MGFLSKLFDGKADQVADLLKKEAARAVREATEAARRQDSAQPQRGAQSMEQGDSWGSIMPDEPNQYNYNGTFSQYFDDIFRTEFPDYAVSWESVRNGRSVIATLSQGGATAAIVELMTEKSGVNRLRRDCAARGIPYVRFYYDHEGWWNTRSYVTRRVQEALGL